MELMLVDRRQPVNMSKLLTHGAPMFQTYHAILGAGQLEWGVDGPPPFHADLAVPVYVTLLSTTLDAVVSGDAVADSMEVFAAAGGPSGFDDPVEWQREQRVDRVLPGRDE